jgi:chaperonin GroES
LATETQTKVQFQPLSDRVVVKPLEPESQRPSGIYVADTAKEKPQKGTIIAVGTGRVLDNGQRQSLEVKEGDTVLFAKYAGTEVKIDGEDLLILSEKDVLAIV